MFKMDVDEEFQKGYDGLSEFSHVRGVLELRDLILSFRTNERYIFISKIVDYDMYQVVDANKRNVEWIQNAKGLESLKYWISSLMLSFNSFAAVYSVIVFSCVCTFGRNLNPIEIESVIFSDFVARLTLNPKNLNEYPNVSILTKDFFRNLRDLKLDETAKKIHKRIYNDYFSYLSIEHSLYFKADIKFTLCAQYLARCFTFHDNRDIVTPEDIVKGWTLTLNLFLTDLRPYINGLDQSVESANLKSNNTSVEVNPPEKKYTLRNILAITASILFFLGLLLLFGCIFTIFTGHYQYGGNTTRLFVLTVSIVLTRIFYKKIK